MAKSNILVIGGLDPQGCSGIAADLKAVSSHGGHGLTLVTALTEQSSQGIAQFNTVEQQQFLACYQAIRSDFSIDAIKIGLIPNLDIAKSIKQILNDLSEIPVVYDPVLAATYGGVAIPQDVQNYVIEELLPQIKLLTPNIDELNALTSNSVAEDSAHYLLEAGLQSCFVKGGHAEGSYVTDYFVSAEHHFYCYDRRHETTNVRGTGCVLASSIATLLAVGHDIRDAIVLARAYISRGIRKASHTGPYKSLFHSPEALTLRDFPKLCYNKDFIGKTFTFPSCPKKLGVYPVVDSYDWIKKLVALNVPTIQLRLKNRSALELDAQIQNAAALTLGENVHFFVNDYWQEAIKHQAYGVHLGQEDLHDANLEEIEAAGLRLGVSTHSYWELARALAINPSYIALGPIYETKSKVMPFSPQGEQRLEQWVSLLDDAYPLVAIGGINLDRAKRLKQTGVGSVAMITAITEASDYQRATQDFLDCWSQVIA